MLTTVVRLLAPFVPHLADAMWDNLVATVDPAAPDSVHLTDFPAPVEGRADPEVDASMELARRVVALGRAARAASDVRTRQPLRAARVKLPAGTEAFAADAATDAVVRREIADELNVRDIELMPDESDMVERTLFPLLPVVGPRHGPKVGAIMAGARSGDWRLTDDGRVEVGGVTLEPDEFQLTARARAGHEVAEDEGLLVALDTTIDDDLAAEGRAREVAHRLQAMRKAAGYEISDRVRVAIRGDGDRLLERHRAWLADELLATELDIGPDAALDAADRTERLDLDGSTLELSVARA